MQSLFVGYKSSNIHYYISENAAMPFLICFHGYGESASSFIFLEKYIGNRFCILAIDMPFHGETEWKEGLLFTPQQLLDIICAITGKTLNDINDIHLTGFSMGGRVALSLIACMPTQVTKVVLLAPDGLKVNGWYWLATQNKAGNLLFRSAMKTPGPFLSILHFANRLKLVNPSVYKFIDQYINSETVRNDLYKRWITMREFRPSLQKIKAITRKNKVSIRLLYGQYDRIIRFETGENFCKGMGDSCRLTIIPTGHQLLQEKNIEYLVSMLKD